MGSTRSRVGVPRPLPSSLNLEQVAHKKSGIAKPVERGVLREITGRR
jgi:hypothetical protein